MKPELGKAGPLQQLAQWTEARLGQGRTGASSTTQSMLEFEMDHARARDAIHTPFNTDRLAADLQAAGFEVLHARSNVKDRAEYLRRPDLGRSLSPHSREHLTCCAVARSLAIVVADGLSSLAPKLHAVGVLEALRPRLNAWHLDVIILAQQARVALGDEIGQLRGAEAVLVLIGERPGLKSFDSLGAYLTYAPHLGRTDAERNCVSNIRAGGLSYEQAAERLALLLQGARALGATGVALKEDQSPQLRT